MATGSSEEAIDKSSINISILPESVLLLIFSSLDKINDRFSVARTCHRWNRIIQDKLLWKDYSLQEDKQDYQTVINLISVGLSSSLLDLDLGMCSEDYFPFLYKPKMWFSLPNLEKLRVGNIDLCVFNFSLLPRTLKSLTIYTTSHFERKSCVQVNCSCPILPNLEHLEIEDCQDVFANDEVDELHGLHLLLSSDRLHTVILKLMHSFFTQQSLAQVSKRLKSVDYVCLHCNTICDNRFEAFVTPLKCVTVLNLQFTNIDADMEALIAMISKLKNLQKIFLSMFWDLRPENLKTLVMNLPELKFVEIYRCRRINKEDLMKIEKLREGLKCQFPRYMRLALF